MATKEDVISFIESMSVLELSEFVKELEEKFGVSAAAPVMVGGAVPAGGDGGAATGKSTGARMIAKKFNLKFLSSGLLYRYASFLILKHKPRNVIIFLEKKFKNLNYKKLDKINLHTIQISKKSALIAKVKKIREILKKYQIRDF